MKKNNTLSIILTIVGAVVVVAGAIAAIIHFWEDIKAYLPCKCEDDFEAFCDECDESFDEEEDVEFIDYEAEV